METSRAERKMEGEHPITAGELDSIWVKTAPPQYFEPLQENLDVDVVIVGAGITGVTTAYYLAQSGKTIALVDDGPVGGGETGRTTAHLVNALDDRYYEFEKLLGEEKTRLAAQSHTIAIDEIEKIISREKIECDFQRVDGYLFLHPDDSRENLSKELEAAKRAGVQVKWNSQSPVGTGEAIRFLHQATFHPMKYLQGLTLAIQNLGGRIFTTTRANVFHPKGINTENGFRIGAGSIVVATNTPVNNRFVIHSKQSAYRSYVVAARIPKGSIENSLYWDTRDPKDPAGSYHYVRLHPLDDEEDWLIVGGEDHKTGQEEDGTKRFERLEEWTGKHFPAARNFEYRWSGQIMEPIDGIAYAGKNPLDADNIFVATGDSGNGMTQGNVSARLIADMIVKRKNDWVSLYDPSRKTPAAIQEYLKENLNVAVQYSDFLKKGDIVQIQDLMPGEGAILKEGLEALAVYCDEEQRIHSFSAICPHLKCCVSWNATERTFDCPCHGSRFTSLGEVINGPSVSNLEPKEIYRREE
jgi:glycine/D-amino acid oxidase-like deaminating enzyme/nitrite reductase/ring-hydroxylating ferredoxin subunit